MHVFRTIFFLGAIAILLPTPPGDRQRQSLLSSAREVTTPEIIYAASRTASDFGGFCGRQPMVCDTAGFIAEKLGAKAKYSAKLIYEWANEASSPPSGIRADDEGLATASLPHVAEDMSAESQNTLKVEDLIPDWRNPLPPKKS